MIWDGTEKRKRVRVNLPCRIIIYPPQEEEIDAVINNISEGGIGLTLRKKLEVSTTVGLKIYEIVKTQPILCKGIVRWVKSIESSQWKGDFFFNLGIEFYEIHDRDVLAIRNLIRLTISDRE